VLESDFELSALVIQPARSNVRVEWSRSSAQSRTRDENERWFCPPTHSEAQLGEFTENLPPPLTNALEKRRVKTGSLESVLVKQVWCDLSPTSKASATQSSHIVIPESKPKDLDKGVGGEPSRIRPGVLGLVTLLCSGLRGGASGPCDRRPTTIAFARCSIAVSGTHVRNATRISTGASQTLMIPSIPPVRMVLPSTRLADIGQLCAWNLDERVEACVEGSLSVGKTKSISTHGVLECSRFQGVHSLGPHATSFHCFPES
jgi:hypothetical protein